MGDTMGDTMVRALHNIQGSQSSIIINYEYIGIVNMPLNLRWLHCVLRNRAIYIFRWRKTLITAKPKKTYKRNITL